VGPTAPNKETSPGYSVSQDYSARAADDFAQVRQTPTHFGAAGRDPRRGPAAHAIPDRIQARAHRFQKSIALDPMKSMVSMVSMELRASLSPARCGSPN
jgi:hypothetical protein